MRLLKEIVYWSLVLTGLTWAAARFNRRKILVLAYHDVCASPADPVHNFDGLRVRLDRFERQMQYLAAHYHVVPLDQLLDTSAGSRRGKPLAAITFDDGYKNIYHFAYPILRRFGLPATVFVIADFSLHGRAPWWERLRAIVAAAQTPAAVVPIRATRRWFRLVTEQDRGAALLPLSAELRRLPPGEREDLLAHLAADLGVEERGQARCEPLSVDELREMTEGGIAVGSHGRSHDSFLHLTREGLFAELTESKQVLESVMERPVAWLAYPYGDYSEEVIEAAVRAGYQGAVTTVEGLNDRMANPFAIRRVSVDNHLSFAHFVVSVSGLRDMLKGLLRIGVGRSRAMPVPSGLPEG